MPGHTGCARLTGIHAEILGRLQQEFVEALEVMAQHVEAADIAAAGPSQTRYHLQQALAAATTMQTRLHQISQYCGAIESAIR